MAREETIAGVYGGALFAAARRQGKMEEVWEGVRALVPLVAPRSPLRHFLAAPHIAPEQKKTLLSAVFASRVDSLLLDFMHLLVDRRRAEALEESLREFDAQAHTARGLVASEVVSAHPLDSELRHRLLSALEKMSGKTFDMTWRVDPKLLGGVVVHYEDILLDGSLSSRLRDLETHLRATPLAQE